MLFSSGFIVGAVLLGGAILVLLETGRRIGRRFGAGNADHRAGLGTIESAVLALLGLIIAFTFSGAKTRFDVRRDLIVHEANAVGTAALRLDLLPPGPREALRSELRAYVDARLAATRGEDASATTAVERHQASLWSGAVEATRGPGMQAAALLLLPALNDLFDLATTRAAAARAHMAPPVFTLLLVLIAASALLAGFGMSASPRRSWLHLGCFAGALLLAVLVIVDLEFPRFGLIRLDSADAVLVQARDAIH